MAGQPADLQRVSRHLTNSRYHDYCYNVPSLRDEISQSRPFAHAAEEAFVNVWRTAEVLLYAANEALAPHGLTVTQYNTLRILRGGGAAGLTCAEIGARMVSVAPDVTRLLDRLTQLGLIARERGTVDRRVVTTRLTPAGRRLVDALDQPMAELQRQRLAGLNEDQLRQLSGLLERARPDPTVTR